MYEDSKTVKKWLDNLSLTTRVMALGNFNSFLNYLHAGDSKFKHMGPDELITYQAEASTSSQYEILDELKTFINSLEGKRYSYLTTKYAHCKSFFMHNRAALPRESFRIRADVPSVIGKLTVEDVRLIVARSTTMYRSVFLAMLGGGLGREELIYWSDHGLNATEDQLRRGVDLLRVDLPGRKAMKNRNPYYTLLGGDALEALKKWMAERSMLQGESIYLNQFRKPLTSVSLYHQWRRSYLALKLSEKGTPKNRRWSGRGTHELRDSFRTLWAKSGAAPQVAEFCMGHIRPGDQYGYDKSHLDEAFVRKEYRRALPMLNILTSSAAYGLVGEERVIELESKYERLRALVEAMGEKNKTQ